MPHERPLPRVKISPIDSTEADYGPLGPAPRDPLGIPDPPVTSPTMAAKSTPQRERKSPKVDARVKMIYRTEFAGKGCMVQGIALACPVVGFFVLGSLGGTAGLILAPVIFFAGQWMAGYWACSKCGTRLDGGYVEHCPGCHSELK